MTSCYCSIGQCVYVFANEKNVTRFTGIVPLTSCLKFKVFQIAKDSGEKNLNRNYQSEIKWIFFWTQLHSFQRVSMLLNLLGVELNHFTRKTTKTKSFYKNKFV